MCSRYKIKFHNDGRDISAISIDDEGYVWCCIATPCGHNHAVTKLKLARFIQNRMRTLDCRDNQKIWYNFL